MKIDFTKEIVYSFKGPNLCLLGNTDEFRILSKLILELTDTRIEKQIDITKLEFAELVSETCVVLFASKKGARNLGVIHSDNIILLELDHRYWERIFQFSALLSWDKLTYYLNYYEDGLRDLNLEQDCNLIFSSEW